MHAGDGTLIDIPELHVLLEQLQQLDRPHLAKDEILGHIRQVADHSCFPVAHAEFLLELGGDELGTDVFQPTAISSVLDGGDGEEWPFFSDFVGDDLGEKLVILFFLLHLLLHLRQPTGIVLEGLSKS